MSIMMIMWVASHLGWLIPHLSHGPYGFAVWTESPYHVLGFGHTARAGVSEWFGYGGWDVNHQWVVRLP